MEGGVQKRNRGGPHGWAGRVSLMALPKRQNHCEVATQSRGPLPDEAAGLPKAGENHRRSSRGCSVLWRDPNAAQRIRHGGAAITPPFDRPVRPGRAPPTRITAPETNRMNIKNITAAGAVALAALAAGTMPAFAATATLTITTGGLLMTAPDMTFALFSLNGTATTESGSYPLDVNDLS